MAIAVPQFNYLVMSRQGAALDLSVTLDLAPSGRVSEASRHARWLLRQLNIRKFIIITLILIITTSPE